MIHLVEAEAIEWQMKSSKTQGSLLFMTHLTLSVLT